VVTGGGGGIGAAIAESLGSTDTFVAVVDPLVSVDGAARLPRPDDTTVGRIVAAGGHARHYDVSVTDAASLGLLFTELADEFGGVDAVVNVAGITRPTGFASGNDDDWQSVLSVHLEGYCNVLGVALPHMAAAGRGHILGVTSGSGWRSADAGAYGCAKRAVSAMTWQLGRQAPPGVVVNAISPIAATRMVAAALQRAGSSSTRATDGLSLAAMPPPRDLGPLGAHLLGADFDACRGRVIFTAGSEIAMIDEPRLTEVVQYGDPAARILEGATAIALAPAEASQAAGGGSNPRLSALFTAAQPENAGTGIARCCAVVTEEPSVAASVCAALESWGAVCRRIDTPEELAAACDLDAVVVASSGRPAASTGADWQRVLAEHDDIVGRIHTDARWARAAADHAATQQHSLRLVTVTAATTAGGRTRAQASAQLARAARQATGDLVSAYAVSAESEDFPAELAAHLACSAEARGLAGAEIVSSSGWFGLRIHPRPVGAIAYDGPSIPPWLDATLREMARS
jgi:NAD(P)-dependent dehydrogenase (short-subunit alcohol dehydrogenase family)